MAQNTETVSASSGSGDQGNPEPEDVALGMFTCRDFLGVTLQTLYNSTHLSDVTLVVGSKEYPAHRMMLATLSPYFSNLLYGNWLESTQQKIRLAETPACEEVFDQFLKFFYGIDVAVTTSSLWPIFILADKYDVVTLRRQCEEYAIKSLEDSNVEGAVQWLSFAEQISDNRMVKWCYRVIRHNLDEAASLPAWESLTQQQVIKVLTDKSFDFENVESFIVTKNALSEFKAAEKWLMSEQNRPNLPTNGKPVLDAVLFLQMNVSHLLAVENSELARESCMSDNLKEKIAIANKFLAIKAVPFEERCSLAEEYLQEMWSKIDVGIARWYTEKCGSIIEVNNGTGGNMIIHRVHQNQVKGTFRYGNLAQVTVDSNKYSYLIGFVFNNTARRARPLMFDRLDLVAYNNKHRILHVCTGTQKMEADGVGAPTIPVNRGIFSKRILAPHPFSRPKIPYSLGYFISVTECSIGPV